MFLKKLLTKKKYKKKLLYKFKDGDQPFTYRQKKMSFNTGTNVNCTIPIQFLSFNTLH